jgi:two-component system sensor histidine kinase FlrB
MGEMSAHLAHQMRTPLSTALLYVSHLANDQLDREKRHQFTAKLRERLQHMERQIHDILLFARGADAGQTRISLSDLVGKFSIGVDPEMKDAGVELEIDDQSNGRAIMVGREDALLGVLSNLLENAVQQGARRVRLSLRVDSEIELDVDDDGSGVPDELQQRIFDPFFTTRNSGTGLGLAVVQNLVLNHCGEISCGESDSGGALFHLRFPLALRRDVVEQKTMIERRSVSEHFPAMRSLS